MATAGVGPLSAAATFAARSASLLCAGRASCSDGGGVLIAVAVGGGGPVVVAFRRWRLAACGFAGVVVGGGVVAVDVVSGLSGFTPSPNSGAELSPEEPFVG